MNKIDTTHKIIETTELPVSLNLSTRLSASDKQRIADEHQRVYRMPRVLVIGEQTRINGIADPLTCSCLKFVSRFNTEFLNSPDHTGKALASAECITKISQGFSIGEEKYKPFDLVILESGVFYDEIKDHILKMDYPPGLLIYEPRRVTDSEKITKLKGKGASVFSITDLYSCLPYDVLVEKTLGPTGLERLKIIEGDGEIAAMHAWLAPPLKRLP